MGLEKIGVPRIGLGRRVGDGIMLRPACRPILTQLVAWRSTQRVLPVGEFVGRWRKLFGLLVDGGDCWLGTQRGVGCVLLLVWVLLLLLLLLLLLSASTTTNWCLEHRG